MSLPTFSIASRYPRASTWSKRPNSLTLGLVLRFRTGFLLSSSSSRLRLSRHCWRKASSSESSAPLPSLSGPLLRSCLALSTPNTLRRAARTLFFHFVRRAASKDLASAMTPLTPVERPMSNDGGGSLTSVCAFIVGIRMAASILLARYRSSSSSLCSSASLATSSRSSGCMWSSSERVFLSRKAANSSWAGVGFDMVAGRDARICLRWAVLAIFFPPRDAALFRGKDRRRRGEGDG